MYRRDDRNKDKADFNARMLTGARGKVTKTKGYTESEAEKNELERQDKGYR